MDSLSTVVAQPRKSRALSVKFKSTPSYPVQEASSESVNGQMSVFDYKSILSFQQYSISRTLETQTLQGIPRLNHIQLRRDKLES